MNIHRAALKHGISDENATQPASWSLRNEDLDDEPPSRQLRLGLDT
jgi:hypothetical protein